MSSPSSSNKPTRKWEDVTDGGVDFWVAAGVASNGAASKSRESRRVEGDEGHEGSGLAAREVILWE